MLFIFKKKQIEIVALVAEERKDILELAPIKRAKDSFPHWWKNVESGYFDFEMFTEIRTVKNCPGIIGTLTNGFIMPLWSDIAIKQTPEGGDVTFADKKTNWKYSPEHIVTGYEENYSNFIIQSPWYLKTPVNVLFCDPVYHFNTPRIYKANYAYQTPINNYLNTDITLSFRKPIDQDIGIIKFRTPMLHFIPITENKVNFRVEAMSPREQEQVRSYTRYRDSFSKYDSNFKEIN